MRLLVVFVVLWSASLRPVRLRPAESLALPGDERVVPRRYDVRLDTTKGAIVIAVHRDWAPNGADRFHELVAEGYFNDSRFFRVVKGQWAQFGINRDPKV